MTTAELEALAHAVAKLAFVAGLGGAIAAHLLMLTAARVVALIGQWVDRHARITAARKRAGRPVASLRAAGRLARRLARIERA